MEDEVHFEIGETGVILFGMNGHLIGAINDASFAVVIDHDNETLRRFRAGVISLYREVPMLEQEVLVRLSQTDLSGTQSGSVLRFMRSLVPLSNVDFRDEYFDDDEPHEPDPAGKVIPFPRARK